MATNVLIPRIAAADVHSLACMEIRGGNASAVYRADLPGLSAWVCCRPLLPATRGGDLYFLSVCSHGSISRVTIADVAGHGEGVSATAENLWRALRDHADDWDQSALIRRLNDGFLKGPVVGKYATAFLMSHYVASGEVLFTNAGHLPPLWRRSALRQWTFLQDATPYAKEIADLPLGMIPGTSYRQTGIQLEPGDLLLLYTDGVNEACDSRGRQLGLDGLLEIANSLPDDSPSAAGEALLAAVARFRGDTPPSDDVTVVALRCLSPSTAPPPRQ
jgi:sigma-B regulation protein RsbU (phosphoserine phosphatase)